MTKNYITETITKEVSKHISSTCNKCGVEKEFEQVDDYIFNNYSHRINVEFEEGSIYENQRWAFDLCEECLVALVRTFSEAPEGIQANKYPRESFEHFKLTGEFDEFSGYSESEKEEVLNKRKEYLAKQQAFIDRFKC
ncbi:hypothetical protein ACFVQB_14190 [Paenibacillus sp. NPDC057886]|uniref:hypothetical protein n=1 Tax=Paenibacillus sp. NPDC057886 TaxID=3346270 RepID=UPI00368EA36E